MKSFSFAILFACLFWTINSSPSSSTKCTSNQRLSAAKAIPHAYNLPVLGESSAAFDRVPFADNCVTTIAADGLPPIPVAIDSLTTRTFAKVTRQVFSHVTGIYHDFPANSTSLITTNVTLGVRDIIPIPVVFLGFVYLDFDQECKIKNVRAFARIPTEVAGINLNEIFSHQI